MAKAAKKRPARSKAKLEAEQEEEQTTLLMPDTETVKNLARRRQSAKKQTAQISGTVGEAIASAIEKKHLDRTAFNEACKFNELTPEKLAISWPHFKKYVRDMGIEERATEQGQLFEEETETVDGDAENVTQLPRRTSETAGAATG